MKNASTCIKCAHDTIWRVHPISFFDNRSANVIVPLPVACRMIDDPDPGLLSRPTKRAEVGTFAAYVCAACGYTELYARDIEGIAALAKGEHGTKVKRSKASRPAERAR